MFRVRARMDGGYGNYGGEIELETSHDGECQNVLDHEKQLFADQV